MGREQKTPEGLVVRRLGESRQRTFPARTVPERCYGSDVWYPKCDVLVPHVLSQFRTISTTSQPLPTPIPNPKREGGRRGSARPSATIASHPRRPRVYVARPSDGPTDPSRGRVAPIQRWNARAIKSSKAIGERAARRTSAGARSVKSN